MIVLNALICFASIFFKKKNLSAWYWQKFRIKVRQQEVDMTFEKKKTSIVSYCIIIILYHYYTGSLLYCIMIKLDHYIYCIIIILDLIVSL